MLYVYFWVTILFFFINNSDIFKENMVKLKCTIHGRKIQNPTESYKMIKFCKQGYEIGFKILIVLKTNITNTLGI